LLNAGQVYQERARREHYMLSTSTRVGVYHVEVPEIAEDDIRSAQQPLPPPNKRIAMERTKRLSLQALRTTRGSTASSELPVVGAGVGAGAATHQRAATTPQRGKVQGPFRSPDEVWKMRNRPLHATLRTATPYTYRQDAEAYEKQREWRERVVDTPFLPTHKHPRPLTTAGDDQKSVRSAEQYVDPPMREPNAPVTRQISFRKFDKLPRSKDFVTTVRAPALFDTEL
jgi:hypothetical protein